MAFWRKDEGEMTGSEARQARKAERVDLARKLARKLPDALESPFFDELRARWPDEPTMAAPVSQLCTAAQFDEADYQRLRQLYRFKPKLHRKQWEFIYILRVIEQAGYLRPGARGLGFGVGREKLPSLLAREKCEILITDLPVEGASSHWVGGPQHTASLEGAHRPGLIPAEDFKRQVDFRPVNMKAIPADLTGFDFCWSACALEHLGSLAEGFDFIRNSLKTLKPGGLAIHTTEFNLGSADRTLKKGGTVVYREKDVTAFAEEMRAEGHGITLNLNPGATPTDRMIDKTRDSDVHIRLYVNHQIPATSIGLTVKKAG